MDFFETRYSNYSNEQVNELYQSNNWRALSPDERLDALQELENRSALSCGNQPCQVRTEAMNGYKYGGYSYGEIVLNENLVNNGEFVTQFKDGSVEHYPVDGINAQLMDTIHHENYHAYQDEVVHGYLQHNDAQEAELWAANWPYDQYISPDDPSGCYRIQSLEKSAFEHGETQTKAAFSEIEAKYGLDNGYQNYLQEIEADSYESALENAIAINGDENIESTINNNMLEAYHESQDSYFTTEADSYSDSDSTSSFTDSSSDGDSDDDSAENSL